MEFRAKTANHQIQMSGSKTEMGPFGTRIVSKGKTIKFENFRYKTNDPDEIRFLKANPSYGIMFAAIEESDRIPEGPKVQMVSGSRGADMLEDRTEDVTALNPPTKNLRKEK